MIDADDLYEVLLSTVPEPADNVKPENRERWTRGNAKGAILALRRTLAELPDDLTVRELRDLTQELFNRGEEFWR